MAMSCHSTEKCDSVKQMKTVSSQKVKNLSQSGPQKKNSHSLGTTPVHPRLNYAHELLKSRVCVVGRAATIKRLNY